MALRKGDELGPLKFADPEIRVDQSHERRIGEFAPRGDRFHGQWRGRGNTGGFRPRPHGRGFLCDGRWRRERRPSLHPAVEGLHDFSPGDFSLVFHGSMEAGLRPGDSRDMMTRATRSNRMQAGLWRRSLAQLQERYWLRFFSSLRPPVRQSHRFENLGIRNARLS